MFKSLLKVENKQICIKETVTDLHFFSQNDDNQKNTSVKNAEVFFINKREKRIFREMLVIFY